MFYRLFFKEKRDVFSVEVEMEKLYKYLDEYFKGLRHPKITEKEREILVGEIVSGVRVLMENPDISFDDWCNKLHELFHEEYW